MKQHERAALGSKAEGGAEQRQHLVYGPVPSRRLGRSLGVNAVPMKVCTYACVYCQLGPTISMTVDRSEFFDPDAVVKEVGRRIAQLRDTGESCDYVTFVANGEPTLDVNLGSEIAAVRELGVNVAVITNGSLLWREDVRRDLMAADWVLKTRKRA